MENKKMIEKYLDMDNIPKLIPVKHFLNVRRILLGHNHTTIGIGTCVIKRALANEGTNFLETQKRFRYYWI